LLIENRKKRYVRQLCSGEESFKNGTAKLNLSEGWPWKRVRDPALRKNLSKVKDSWCKGEGHFDEGDREGSLEA